jgi:DNA invertase Pin-like site-specific DNA recombinase
MSTLAPSPLHLAASYERKSTVDAMGIEAQYIINAQCAARDGWRIPDDPAFRFGDDATSGTTTSRPGLDRLMDMVKSGAALFTRLYIKDKTRLGRWQDPRMHSWFEVELKKKGVLVRYSEDEGLVDYDADPSTYMGSFMKSSVDSVMTSQERLRTTRRVMGGVHDRIRRGYFPGAIPPYGYERWLANGLTGEILQSVPIRGSIRMPNSVYVLRAATDGSAEIARDIFLGVEAGEPLARIARRLVTDGVPSPGARREKPNAGAWSRGGIARMLRNPLYQGDLVWGRLDRAQLGPPVPIADVQLDKAGEVALLYTDFVKTPLVTRETWGTVQAILDGSRESCKGRRAASPDFLLSGLIKCATCGANFHGASSTRKYVNRRRYYRHEQRRGSDAACTTQRRYLLTEEIEPQIVELLRGWLRDGHLLEIMRSEVTRLEKCDHEEKRRTELNHHEAEIARLTRSQVDAVRREVESTSATQALAYRHVAGELAGKIEAHKHAVGKLQGREETARAAAYRLTQAQNWLKPLDIFELADAEEQRRIVRALIRRITVSLDLDTCEVIVTGP